jgi:putative hydrolase of the HAD superfamily
MNHLFFDLDNTLWDFDRNSFNVLGKLFAENKLNEKLGVDFNSFHDFYYKKNNELWHLYYFGKIKKEELRYKRFHDTFLNFAYDDLPLSHHLAVEYLKLSPYSKGLMPGCEEVLDHFHGKCHLHIITNGFTEVQNIKLDNCGIRKYFNTIIISEEHGLTKPNVEIFRLAEQKANASSDKCVMVGDNWVSDIEGAVGAGWRAIYLSPDPVPEKKHSQVEVITELKQLTQLIR